MERDTLDAWLCGKYAPVSRRAPSQYCFALSPCGTKTAFLHELGFVHKPVNYYIFMLAILDPKAKFYAPDLYKNNSNQAVNRFCRDDNDEYP
ncbi:hypothetical protein PQR25_02195 [Paraburkholderia nemoris]|uniref:hypothetical protein n=1 Tax=Paraburkholderia nemoris TaxID=2793076 RepID=UPI00190A8AB6|nr:MULTISPECIES: hypothetical protein [Paraburkholderia]MBK3814196.1 hypothetical protein [Paraburkholderia aspalathi]MBK5150609.1 hypothetical protein [Burkholderia sp. R-69608]